MLLLALLAVTGAAANSLPRGVSPEFASHYASGGTFTCILAPSKVISASQVNDNTCDCPDGSDEPGTPACAHIDPLSPALPLPGSASGTTNTTPALPGFWCENSGHEGAYVPFAWVNDGVCDYDVCCDGSEEYAHAGGIRCENRCDAIGKEVRRLREVRARAAERAGAAKAALVGQARGMRGEIETSVAVLKDEIRDLEIQAMDLQQKYEETKREEEGKIASGVGAGGDGKIGVLLGLARARVDELRQALRSVVDQRDELRDRVAELEGVLSQFKEEYNPNFNDEGVKRAVKAWEDYAAKKAGETKVPAVAEEDVVSAMEEDGEKSGVNWVEFEHTDDGPTDTDILYKAEAYLPPFMRTYLQGQIKTLRIWLIKNGMLADAPKGAESRLVTTAREAYEAATKKVTQSKNTLGDKERDLAKDYGADDVFRALKGKCVSTDSGEYTYEMCWLDKTTQKSKRGGSNTNMGKFERIDWEDADEEDRLDGKGLGAGKRMVLRYDRGTSCWNGPQRRTDVWLGCSETEELWRVSEAEKCVYRMEIGTPVACGEFVPPVGPEERPEKDEL